MGKHKQENKCVNSKPIFINMGGGNDIDEGFEILEASRKDI